MFGGTFGSFRSKDRHFFDESTHTYRQLARVLDIRRNDLALLRVRQYHRPISEDGSSFWYPARIGQERMTSIVAWSRIMSSREVMCAFNTNLAATRTVWVTMDAGLHSVGDKFQCVYSTDQNQQGSETGAEARNGLAIKVSVPAAGFVIMAP
jgi:hypothetical protein